MAEPYYITAAALRTALGVNSTTLPDATADALIVQAEDWIDSMLGAWYPDETTGRKILQADVLAWQWGKLTRAAALVAAALYNAPTLLTTAQYRKQAGPDFSVEDPLGGGALAPAITLLNASGLRRLTGRAVAGRRPVAASPPPHPARAPNEFGKHHADTAQPQSIWDLS